jgi:hypothetical protein
MRPLGCFLSYAGNNLIDEDRQSRSPIGAPLNVERWRTLRVPLSEDALSASNINFAGCADLPTR